MAEVKRVEEGGRAKSEWTSIRGHADYVDPVMLEDAIQESMRCVTLSRGALNRRASEGNLCVVSPAMPKGRELGPRFELGRKWAEKKGSGAWWRRWCQRKDEIKLLLLAGSEGEKGT